MITNFLKQFVNSICKCCKNRFSSPTRFRPIITVASIEVKFKDHSVLYRIGKLDKPISFQYVLQDTKIVRKSNQKDFDRQYENYDYLVEIEYITETIDEENIVITTFLDQVVRDYINATPGLKENSYGKYYFIDSSKRETRTLKYVKNDCPYECDEWI